MRKKAIKCVILLGISLSSLAQNTNKAINDSITNLASSTLKEIVVSDSKFNLKPHQSGKNIISISSEEIENNPTQDIEDLINQKSGIEINGSRGNDGQNLSYFVRGGTTGQVLILIDGIQVIEASDISSSYDLRNISSANIQHIEILKSPSSVLYGTNASTAVINIITKKANNNPISGSFQHILGTNNTQDNQKFEPATTTNNLNINGKYKNISYVLSSAYQYSDGISAANTNKKDEESDIFNKASILAKLGYQNNKLSLQGSLLYNDFKAEYDNFTLQDAPFYYKNNQMRIGLNTNYKLSSNQSITLNTAYDKFNIKNYSSSFSNRESNNYILDAYYKIIFIDKLHILAGINYQAQEINLETGKYKLEQTDPYLNIVYTHKGFNFNTGIRYNHHSKYGGYTVYQINPSYYYDIDKNNSLKFFYTINSAYKTPTLTQLFGPFGANIKLKPQTSITNEIGLSYNFSTKYKLTISYYDRKETNSIEYTTAYINTDKTNKVRGVEIESFTQIIKTLSLGINYTFVEKDKETLLKIPKQKVNANIIYNITPTTLAALTYQYNDKRIDFGNKELSDFQLINMNISKLLLDNSLKVNLAINNILNERYTETFGYNTKGRNFLIGLLYKF